MDAQAAAFKEKRKHPDAVKIFLIVGLVIMSVLFTLAMTLIMYSEAYLYLVDEYMDPQDKMAEALMKVQMASGGDNSDALEEQIASLQESLQDEKDRNEELEERLMELASNTGEEDDGDDWVVTDEDMDEETEEPEDEEESEGDEEEEEEEEEEDDDDWDDDEDDDDWDDDDWEDEDEDDDDEDDRRSSSSSVKPTSSSSAKPAPAANEPHTMTDRDGNTWTFTADEWNYLLGLYKNTKNPAATAQDHTITELRYLLSLR